MAVRIGITASPNQIDGRPIDEVSTSYVASVRRAGGIPLVLPILDPADADDVLDGIDGLVLSGGGDVDPRRYGAAPSCELTGVDPARDDWELNLVIRALDRDLPVLGTCRGAQVLNVAAGGTLVAHLPAVSDQVHRDGEAVDCEVHPVEVLAGSRLAQAMGRCRAGVNTLHHQAVDRIGNGLRATAWSPDGVIEGIEAITHHRALGVQWHPELLRLPGSPELFDWLVAEATRGRILTGVTTPVEAAGLDLVDAVA